jgi:apolipoprotein N-acyltransferase
MPDTPIASKTTDCYLTRHSILLVVFAGLASAAFFYFGTGLHPIWWMLWLAPVPVLAVAPRFRAGSAFLLG